MKKVLLLIMLTLSMSDGGIASENSPTFSYSPVCYQDFALQCINGISYLVLTTSEIYNFAPHSAHQTPGGLAQHPAFTKQSNTQASTTGSDDEFFRLYGNISLPRRTDTYWLRSMSPNTDNIFKSLWEKKHR